ncbi:MAG: SOS response-associated peptidase [Anaerolineae bacterium]|nr:SOS response-associated peptidase [Anaerolineae bacterium]
MCGRFTLTKLDPDLVAKTFALDSVPALSPRYNIAPTQPVAAVIHDVESAQNQLAVFRWGLIPHWSKDATIGSRLINARGETVAEKPSFRAALRYRRCLIIADGFYEWQTLPDGSKQPMYITLRDRGLFGMAGLWERWTDPNTGEIVPTCTIITTTPNDFMAPIHNRMPVILPSELYAAWLDPTQTVTANVLPLLQPYPAGQMTGYPVSRRVNRPTNDDPSLIERAG